MLKINHSVFFRASRFFSAIRRRKYFFWHKRTACLVLAMLAVTIWGACLAMVGIDPQILKTRASASPATMLRPAYMDFNMLKSEDVGGVDVNPRFKVIFEVAHQAVVNPPASHEHSELELVDHIRTVSGFPVYRRPDGTLTTDQQGGGLPRGEVLLDRSGAEVDVHGHVLKVSNKAAPL